jgi:hypothetical protein
MKTFIIGRAWRAHRKRMSRKTFSNSLIHFFLCRFSSHASLTYTQKIKRSKNFFFFALWYSHWHWMLLLFLLLLYISKFNIIFFLFLLLPYFLYQRAMMRCYIMCIQRQSLTSSNYYQGIKIFLLSRLFSLPIP